MDPLSITASVAGLISLVAGVYSTVDQLVSGAHNADSTLKAFKGEVSSLLTVLESLDVTFQDPKQRRILEEANNGTGNVAHYWRGVLGSMEHCKKTLENMSAVLDGVESAKRTRLFRSFGKHLKLSSSEGVLTLYRQEILSHTSNLQISLHMIGMYDFSLAYAIFWSCSR
jgi:hypothetical protein